MLKLKPDLDKTLTASAATPLWLRPSHDLALLEPPQLEFDGSSMVLSGCPDCPVVSGMSGGVQNVRCVSGISPVVSGISPVVSGMFGCVRSVRFETGHANAWCCPEGVRKVSGYVRTMSGTCPGPVRDLSGTCPETCPDMSGTCPVMLSDRVRKSVRNVR